MKRFSFDRTALVRAEFVVAILLTIVLLAFHVIFFVNAGPLWRDEISSVALATKPTLNEFWKSLTFDPFPPAYFLLLRFWDALGFGHNDLALRLLGLLIGISLIGALWLSSWLIDRSRPLWALALFAFNPWTLEAGDSLRPYGLSLIWIVLAFALLWRVTGDESGKTTIAFALIAVVLSVQSTFLNALLVFAIATGATVVLVLRRDWSKLALIFAISAVSALSLVPYLPTMRWTQDWTKIIGNKNDVTGVLAVARDAIAGAGRFAEWTWLTLGAIASCAFILAIAARGRFRPMDDSARDRVLFAGSTVITGAVATVGFLCAARYLVFPRYFLGFLAIAALAVDIFWNVIGNPIAVRAARICLSLVVATGSVLALSDRARMRMTNCDRIAAAVEQRANPDDLIIITSSFYGVSFQRYYHGRANWVTLPQLSDYSLHRWDLLKQAMVRPDPVPDLISRAQNVLQAGHKIFLVGKLGAAPATEPEPLPPAPQSQFGWQMEAYTNQWKSELTYWFEHHALHGTNLPVDQNERLNPLEQLGLFEVAGWRGD